jgi:hypothetical protein
MAKIPKKSDSPPTTVQFVIKSINFTEDFHQTCTQTYIQSIPVCLNLIKLRTVNIKHINMPRNLRKLYVTPWTRENYVITCCLTSNVRITRHVSRKKNGRKKFFRHKWQQFAVQCRLVVYYFIWEILIDSHRVKAQNVMNFRFDAPDDFRRKKKV